MTNQASELYELCQEVYKRFPEWRDTVQLFDPWGQAVTSISLGGETPLYTSDYLLEKLPNVINYHSETSSKTILGLFRLVHCENGQWLATYSKLKLNCYAHTPLLALLKLTIALSEAGELK